MDKTDAVIYAIVQGLTELLPVSSSGHLVLLHTFSKQGDNLAFDVAVHFGTLLAVVLYFGTYLFRLTADWAGSIRQRKKVGDSNLAWAVIWGTAPVGFFGVFLHLVYDGHMGLAYTLATVIFATIAVVIAGLWMTGHRKQAKALFLVSLVAAALFTIGFLVKNNIRSAVMVSITLMGFGILLLYADFKGKHSRKINEIGWHDVMWIGMAQAIALLPGTSRSGITITAALFLGFMRSAGARFSFLLSIPAILAATALVAYKYTESGKSAGVGWDVMLVGIGVSAVTAYLCIHVFLRLIDRIGMMPFVVYRLCVGALLIGMMILGYVELGPTKG